jgi:hypothetical protein
MCSKQLKVRVSQCVAPYTQTKADMQKHLQRACQLGPLQNLPCTTFSCARLRTPLWACLPLSLRRPASPTFPPGSPLQFTRSTTKYWVHPSNILRLKLALTKQLPLLVYGADDPVSSGDVTAVAAEGADGAEGTPASQHKVTSLVSSGKECETT